jgi:hypothetical protein
MNQDDAFPEAPASHPGSMVMVDVNGAQYPMKRVAQCRTCTSPHRRDIERMILDGVSYNNIVREIGSRPEPDRWPHPLVSSVRTHVANGHMPIGPTMERALIERRSQEIGRDLEGHQESLIDYAAANELIIQRGMARVFRGELKPTMTDLMKAISVQHTIHQATEEGVDADTWQDALLAYMEVAQEFVPPERQQAFGQALSRHPVLKAMAAKAAGLATPTIGGEVVREGLEG